MPGHDVGDQDARQAPEDDDGDRVGKREQLHLFLSRSNRNAERMAASAIRHTLFCSRGNVPRPHVQLEAQMGVRIDGAIHFVVDVGFIQYNRYGVATNQRNLGLKHSKTAD